MRALVTGASRGIGRAVVAELVGVGHEVVAVARDEEALARVVAEEGARGGRVEPRRCDLGDPEQVARLHADFHDVDVFVAAAGVAMSAPLARTDLAEWERLHAVNVTAVFLGLQQVLPGMLERGFGRAVVVASTAALTGGPYIAAYSASKHAVLGLVRSAAAEVAGTQVTVNAVCPGYVRTSMTDETLARIVATTGRDRQEALEAILAGQPLGRLVEPEEVAAAIGYLVSRAAAPVNGQHLVLDGGGLP